MVTASAAMPRACSITSAARSRTNSSCHPMAPGLIGYCRAPRSCTPRAQLATRAGGAMTLGLPT
jgi:hypothetical protein